MSSIINTSKRLVICMMMLTLSNSLVKAQTTQPTWWFGVSGAANFNFYDGTTQRLNNSLIVPAAFHKGSGIRPYGSILMEYRPGSIWGGMLNIGYDGRGGKFDGVTAPCDCPATLETNTSYISLEPSLRLGLPSTGLYFFAGPRIAFNLEKDFSYTQLKQDDTNAELSAMRKTLFSGQVGIGYDIPVSPAGSLTQTNLSPFVSFHPYFGGEPRDIESWSITTVRAGIALKFGKASKVEISEIPAVVPEREVTFAVRAPKLIPNTRQVSETLPLLNYVFFDQGSVEVPNRYVHLSKNQATQFKEEQLQTENTETISGRSARQLNVYHNILNIVGDRMRSNPNATISLSGASANGENEGEAFAQSIKQYLVSMFGIEGTRVTTIGRKYPLFPSSQPGSTRELPLLREDDRRVDIASNSLELLNEVGGAMKPVQINSTQIDPLDSHLILNVDGAKEVFKSWSIDIADENGVSKHYGPFTKDQESLPGKLILGDRSQGDYKISMVGETKNGLAVRKETTVHLARQEQVVENAKRYSILFDFDKAKTRESYENFLAANVSPLIKDESKVIIHGHTDVIGDEEYNYKLSQKRAQETQEILERGLISSGRRNVEFETLGFGEDSSRSAFDNTLPEERFYNRTVIIDIVPAK